MMLFVLASVLLVVVAAFALLAWQQREDQRWPNDAEGLADMRQRGPDLSRPCTFELHPHFASREVAVDAAEAISAAGYGTRVGGGPGTAVAIVCASKSLDPDEVALRAERTQLVSLCRRFGGSYQGWFGCGPTRTSGQ